MAQDRGRKEKQKDRSPAVGELATDFELVRLDAFLKCIPLAALGALIIPGAFQATPELPAAGLAGMAFTAAYGLLRGGIIGPVVGSVIVTSLVFFANG